MGDEGQQADDARAEAAAWFARLKSVPVSHATLQEFFAWRRVDGNNEAFEAVERVWAASGGVADRPAIQAATAAALAHGGRRARWSKGGARILTAALGALAVGTVATVLTVSNRGEQYRTQVGQQSIVTLEDGSKVTLDTDTSLSVRYSSSKRQIILDHGQAYFAVAHATDRPFLVDAAEAEVRATGTQFAVRQIGDATEVTLVEGSVEVTAPRSAGATRLGAGQQYRLADAQPPTVRRVDTAAGTAWRRGRIIFDDATLAAAVDEVNRYARRPIQLASTALADRRLSGSFETGDVEGFAAAAAAILPLAVEHGADGAVRLVDRSGSDRN